MALKDTTSEMQKLLQGIVKDLTKAGKGNKAASQRIRTGTIRLEKVGKKYRKESIALEKSSKFKRKTTKSRKKTTRKRKVVRKKVVRRKRR